MNIASICAFDLPSRRNAAKGAAAAHICLCADADPLFRITSGTWSASSGTRRTSGTLWSTLSSGHRPLMQHRQMQVCDHFCVYYLTFFRSFLQNLLQQQPKSQNLASTCTSQTSLCIRVSASLHRWRPPMMCCLCIGWHGADVRIHSQHQCMLMLRGTSLYHHFARCACLGHIRAGQTREHRLTAQ